MMRVEIALGDLDFEVDENYYSSTQIDRVKLAQIADRVFVVGR